ncbi:FG-GAP repeat domain-containing protein [Cerasicoccus maritimus]|uniref:FG-GAP repeat domain-containing protein n=1 Tax=Cerasicoccus maritimus TaxID=490089 RepID=UPI002852C9AE|nr:VCBS repeat-containing protein [Cerasicoccus maritimus]
MRYLTAFLLISSAALANEFETNPIRLTGPEVTKIDWSVRALAQDDVDGDGKLDIGVINNDRARIEIYYQRAPGEVDSQTQSIRRNRWEPVLEDTRFEVEGVTSGIAMFDLALGDVTGDGQTDVIFTSKDEPLVAVAQLDDGDWSEKREYDGVDALPWKTTLQLVELSDRYDGLELVALTKNRLMVFAFDENATPIKLHETYRLEANAMDLEVLPANKDLPLRFSYRAPGSSRALRIIEWQPGSGLGAEQAYRLDATTPSIAWVDPKGEDPELVLIEPRTGRLRVEQLQAASLENGDDWPMEYYSTSAEAAAADAYAWGDFNGDGLLDMVVADSANAQIWQLQGKPGGGWLAPESFPSFRGVESLAAADINGDGKSELFALSSDEGVIGLTHWNGDRFVFPQVIGVAGDPVKIAWAPERQQLILISSDNSQQKLSLLSQKDGTWVVDVAIELDGMRRPPSGLMLADLDQNGSQDLLITFPRYAARYIDLDQLESLPEDERGKAVYEIDGLREVNLADTGLGDVNGDGLDELLITSNGFVRAVYLDSEKRRTVLDQFNSRSGNDNLSIPHLRDVDGDGVAELLLFDTRSKEFQILSRDDSGIYRYARSVEFGDFAPLGILPSDATGGDLVLLGKNAILRTSIQQPWQALQNLSTYESDLDDIVYNQIAVGELNGENGPEFVLIDGQNNVLEVIKYVAPDTWQSALHFNVFEEDIHYGGRKGAPLEPREVIIGDFTNDGRQDIILLVHDRMLLYPQGGAEPVAGQAVN